MKEELINPVQKRKMQDKLVTYSERYEEELKQQLFKESQADYTEEDVNDVLYRKTTIHSKHPDQEWDVPLSEEIKYFDPELSYELTGYRPLTLEQGLDFDPEPFRVVGKIYDSTGNYTEYPADCKPYMDFWKEQYKRCKEGYTVGKYRITGDHYFFLNFYRMETIIEGTMAGSGRQESFPGFIAKQYEFFHYVDMAEKLHKDIALLKARGLGASEMLACLAVRPYTTNKNYNVMLTCAAEAKLTPLREKCWRQLDWLNLNTNGGMRHARLVINNNETKKASLKTPDGIEYGWRSMITTIVADNANKVRGSRLDRLLYDEAGSNSCLTDSWIKGDALVSLGGYRFGVKMAIGTGGDAEACEGLQRMFYDPDAYNILPYKNYDTDNEKPELTAFFIPAHKFSLMKEYVDNRGVTNYPEFKKVYEAQRAKLTDEDFLKECAEHCFTPKEALSYHGDNLFDATAIAERMVQIKIKENYIKPRRTQLLWDANGNLKVQESLSSHLWVVEPPLLDEHGKPYKNLYVAGIDAIDMGRDDSATDNDVSDFCIVIKKRVFGMNEPRYVAIYKDRPRDIRDAYEISLKLLTWYNCQALLEYTKISIQTYFKDKNKMHLLMSRPEFAMPSTKSRRPKKRLIGIQATESVIKHGLELISSFLTDFWFTIDYEEMLDQLLNYSYENKRKFDIIAAMQCAEIADEELSGVTPTVINSVSSQWKDFGWYTDEYGRKQRGVIPRH